MLVQFRSMFCMCFSTSEAMHFRDAGKKMDVSGLKTVSSCGGLDEECITRLMCNSEKVCKTWKQQHVHCRSALIAAPKQIEQTSFNRSLMRRAQVRNNDAQADGLDSAVKGKCAI